MALTERQRKQILTRDDFESQFPAYNELLGWHQAYYCPEQTCSNLEVHHIDPVKWLNSQDPDINRGNVDTAQNLISIPKCVHVGVCPDRKIDGSEKYFRETDERPILHADIQMAFQEYAGAGSCPNSFEVCFEIRDEFIQGGKIYWNNDWDDVLRQIAEERTKIAAARGWIFNAIYDAE